MTTDPRFARSADSLADAVLALAAERPIERVTVTEVARLAGVTRATFYNHATSPAALLAQVLERELDEIRADFLGQVAADPGGVEQIWRASELVLVGHVLAHQAVYRQGLTAADDPRGSVLATLVANHVEVSLGALARSHGMPEAGPEATRVAMAAAFVGQGTAGALRAWLNTPAPLDPDEAVDALLSLIPPMWFAVARA
ncbi:TetR/AcrR family transcriptional regulator [Demequina sp. SYSU T00192]|uniref:TetR/AcrR family transcriptional regulator n=1 Tax=Demequina litoralis TaxID=3051660 RepID=A0ABT8GCB1_9MICO|nr:TetR/AcrR family transcriptional regulator [Demequina sp. SYSU T00192]MDN4476697.1 TetR/AcrR family transcriptional regulator [Demequina sp. SYSU T00192]